MNKIFLNALLAIVGLIVAMWVIFSSLTNTTGGISGALKFLGIGAALITFFKPKLGLLIICLEVAYLDYFKKLGAYYGVASQQTTIEILAVAALSIGALWAAMLVQIFVGRRGIRKHELVFVGFVIVWAAFNYFTTTSFTGAVQKVVNGAGILGVSLAMSVCFNSKEEIIKFVRIVFWILLPWPILGLWQYFVGYADFEVWYSHTMLSTTNFPLDVWEVNKGFRMPIGFGSFKPGYAVVGAMYLFALWHAVVYKHKRWLYTLGFLICFVGIFLAASRTATIMPIIILIVYYGIRTKLGGTLILLGGIISILGLTFASDYLLERIPDINDAIAIEGMEQTLNINTASDRFKSLSMLKDPENWSLTGTRSATEGMLTHSMAADILLQYGILGVIVLTLISLAAIWVTAKILYQPTSLEQNRQIRFAVAYLFFLFVTMLLGGSSFHTQPGNLLSAAFIGFIAGNLKFRGASHLVSEIEEEETVVPVLSGKRSVGA